MSIEQLQNKAREANAQAYAPYSQFRVSAALMAADGRVFTGVNVENASYGLTVCAERNAIFTAVGQGLRSFDTIVIYTPTAVATPPCGACRQVIKEFAPKARVISICDSDDVLDSTIEELLPGSFSL